MAQKRIKFGIDFEVNQSGLNQLRSSLNSLSNIKTMPADFKGTQQQFEAAKTTIIGVRDALTQAFNVRLNTTDITKFRESLNQAGISTRTIQSDFARMGGQGKKALLELERGLHGMKMQAKEANSFLQEISITMLNAAKWSIAYGTINKVAEGIRNAYQFTKDLDESLNSIRVVTGKSSDEMDIFADKANKAAAALGKTTKEYTQASLIFYQQGLSDQDVAARTDVALKAANVTGQNAQEVSQQLTAIWNGYRVSAEQAEEYIDKVSAVAATTASNLQELSEGMSKVASSANAMGVDIDQLNAQLSTIIAVTRQDAGTAGTALKTIFARITSIQSGLDTETTLGEYTAKMAKFGISVLDAQGELRNVGEIMEEIGAKWNNFSETQQVALAQAMAGTRQYNNLMALFNNWDMYTKSLETSREAVGALQKQQDIYMESLEGHLEQLTAAKENLYNSLFDSSSFKDLIDSLTKVVNEFASFTDAMGGFKGLLLMITPLLLTAFGPTLANSLVTTVTNMKMASSQTAAFKTQLADVNAWVTTGKGTIDQYSEAILGMRQRVLQAVSTKLINQAEFNEMQESINQIEEKAEALYKYEASVNQAKETVKQLGLEEWNVQQTEAQRQGEVGENYSKVVTGVQKAIDKLKEFEITSTNIKSQSANLKELGFSDQDIASIDKIIQEMDKLKSAGQENTQEYETLSNKLQDTFGAALEKTQSRLESVRGTIETAGSGMRRGLEQGITQGLQRMQTTADKIDLGKGISQFGQLASSAMMVVSALNSLSNIKNIINNKEISNGEKFKQVLTALFMSTALLSPVIARIVTGFKNFSAAVKLAATKLVASNGSLLKSTVKYNAALAVQKGNLTDVQVERLKELGILKADGTAYKKYNQEISEENLLKAQEILQEKLGTEAKTDGIVATTTETIAEHGLTLALKAKAKAAWEALAPMLPYVAIVAAIAAVIFIAVKAIQSLVLAYNKEEEALKSANESLKEQKELYDEAKKSYEELKSSIENYKNAQKAIDEMTKGTQEWKDAIQEANEQVLELMESYPELASYIKSENGRLTIDEAGLAIVEVAKRRETNEALARKINAQQEVRSAQETLDAKNLNKELGTGQGAGDYWGSLISGLLFSSKTYFQGWQDIVNGDVWKGLGEFIPLVGAFIAAADDQIDAQQRATTKTEKALSRLADAYLVRGEEVFLGSNIDEILGDDFGSLTETIKDNIDAIKDNTIAIAASKQAQDIENQEIMRSWFEGNSTAFAESTDKIAKAITTGTTGKAYQEALEEAEKKWEDKGHLGGGITDAEVQKKYAQMIGAEDWKNESGNRGSYLINGEWKTYSDKTARSALAQKEAMEAIGKDFDFAKAIKLSEKLTNKFGEKTSSVLANLAGGKSEISLEELSNKQREALLKELKSFGEEEAKVLGYESKEALQEALNNSINAAEDMWNSASEGMSEEFKIYFKNVNLKSYKAIADAMKKMDNASQNAIYNTLDQITDEYDKEQFAKAIAETNWTQFNAKDKFQELLQGYSVNISAYAEQINSISDTFFSKISDPDTWNTKNVYKYLESIEKVSKSLKSFGDIISKEDFQKYSQELQKYFIKVGEDSYALATSKLAFEEARQKERNEKIGNLLTRFDEAKRQQQIVNRRAEIDSELNGLKYDTRFRTSKENYVNQQAQVYTTAVNDLMQTFKEVDFGAGRKMTVEKEYSEKAKEAQDVAKRLSLNVKTSKNVQDILNKASQWGDQVLTTDEKNQLDSYYQQVLTETQSQQGIYLHYQNLYKERNKLSAKALTETDITELINTFQGATSREQLEELNQIVTDLDNYDWSNFADDEEIAKKKAAIAAAQDQAALNIKLYETQKEIAFAQSKVEAATEGVNAALEKYNQILSNLQKTAKSFALTEEEITENLDAQIDATKETLEQNKKLLNFYSEGGEQQQFLKDQLKIKSLDSDSQSKINNLFNNVTADTLDAALIQTQAIVDAAVSDPTAAEDVYNQIKESLAGEVSRQSNYLKTKGTIIDNTVSLAQAEVQKLRNISDDYIKLLDSEKNINEFLRKIAEFQKNYGNIGDSYLSDYTIATEKYDKYSKSVANQMERIEELKGKALLTTGEAAELEELQNKVVEDQKGLQDSILARQEAIQKVEETRLNLGQKINEQYEKQIKSAENLISIINHQIKLNKILNGEKAYGVLSGNYQGIYEQREEQRQLALSKYNEAWFTYNELGPNATDEVREKALNDIVETGKAALTSIEQTLDAAKQAFEYNIKATLDTVASIAATEAGINNYNWQYDFDTNHMSGLTRDLQLSNLSIKYQKAINQYAADESAQKRLLSVYQEVNKVLEKKETITKNDIALAEKRLALEQARIDLENAQNDTSKMKLVRGANGEYTYQYMADENNILDKMAAYNTAELNYQEAVRASIKDTTSEVTKLIDLFNQLSTAETDEDREEIWNRIVQQIGALKDSAEGLDLSALPKSVQTFIEEWTSKGSASLDKLKKDCEDIAKNYETVKTSMQEASAALTGTGEDGEQSLTTAIKTVKDNADELQGTLDKMKSTFDNPNDGLLKQVIAFKTSLSTAIDEITTQATGLIGLLGQAIPKINKDVEEEGNPALTEPSGALVVPDQTASEQTSQIPDSSTPTVSTTPAITLDRLYQDLGKTFTTFYDSYYKRLAKGDIVGAEKSLDATTAMVENYYHIDLPGLTSMEEFLAEIEKYNP